MLVGLDGALLGAYFAVPFCFVAGFVLSKPHPRWYVRAAWFLLMSICVLAVNSVLAFAGCMVVLR